MKNTQYAIQCLEQAAKSISSWRSLWKDLPDEQRNDFYQEWLSLSESDKSEETIAEEWWLRMMKHSAFATRASNLSEDAIRNVMSHLIYDLQHAPDKSSTFSFQSQHSS